MLVVDKKAGVSSAQALNPIKRLVGRGVRVGHAGTLDPFATGTLLVMLGDATRLVPLVQRIPKLYHAKLVFGIQTDTLDPEGAVVAREDPGPYRPMELQNALSGFRGVIQQVPPSYSALKIEGKRAYKYARAGKEVELKGRPVHVMHLGVAQIRWPHVDLHISCGSGTYIRSLARDLGQELGVPAMLQELRRVRIGPFDASRGLEIQRGRDMRCGVESLGEMLREPRELVKASAIEEIELGSVEARRFVMGQRLRLPLDMQDPVEEDPVSVVFQEKPGKLRMLGLGRWREANVLAPYKVFSAACTDLLEMGGDDPSAVDGP